MRFHSILVAMPLALFLGSLGSRFGYGAMPPQQPAAKALAAAGEAMRAGLAAANRNDLAEAHRDFARAVELAPRISASHAALGAVLLVQGDLPPAARELERAHTLAPADGAVTLNLARANSLLGHFAEARKLFNLSLSTSQLTAFSDDETIAYATALNATGSPGEAEAAIKAALQRNPDSAPLEDAHGTLLAALGSAPGSTEPTKYMEQARAGFARAAALDPTLPQPPFHLGAALLALGKPAEAVPPLRQAVAALPGSFAVHLQLGRALSALHQDADALAELHRARQLQPSPTAPEDAFALAVALQASGDSAGALPLFALALSASPALPGNEAYINSAVAHVQTGDAVGALPLYARALRLGPDSPTLREDYGVAYLQQADLDHAISQFRAGLALDPLSAHLHYDLGLAFKLKDDLPSAIPELQRAAELDPGLPDPAYTLGILYTQQGRPAEAAAQLRRATALQPGNGEAWAALAGVLKDAELPGATEALQQAIALEPEQPSLHIQLAAILQHAGDAAGAAGERKIAAELSRAAGSRQRATFALNSGRALLAEGKLPQAVEQLTVATQADPQLPEAHKLLADALARQGKTADAALERRHAETPPIR